MKLNRRKGISLIEVLIATGIGTTLLVWVNSMTTSDNKVSSELMLLASAATESSAISQQIKRYFRRGRGRTLAEIGITQVGAGEPGFSINRTGAFIFNADLRSCEAGPNGFNPITSAANFSRVVFLCCDQDMALNANLPGGGTINLNSACTNSRGLSVQEYRGPSLVYSICRPHITEMHLRQLGTNPFTSDGIVFGLDFKAQTKTFRDGRIVEASPSLRFSVAGSLMNDLSSFSVACYR